MFHVEHSVEFHLSRVFADFLPGPSPVLVRRHRAHAHALARAGQGASLVHVQLAGALAGWAFKLRVHDLRIRVGRGCTGDVHVNSLSLL